MSSKRTFSKNSIALLVLTGAIAVSLSLASFQYSNFTANEILKIASDNVRSNARIQVNDLESVLVHRLDSVTSNLEVISKARSVQSNEFERGQALFNAAQDSTANLTNFYMWLDGEGRIVWLSNINQTAYEQFRGTDLSQRAYFIEARNRQDGAYYSSAIDSNDNITRIYISYPILGTSGEFIGAAVAGIRVDTFGMSLQDQLSPETQSSVGMTDRSGMILYSESSELIGKDVFGPEFQSLLLPGLKDSFNRFLTESLQGQSGIQDFTVGNATYSIAYEPIIIGGEQFGTLYVVTPHQFADNVRALADQQRDFSSVMVIVIGVAAIGVAALVLAWNSRLERVVAARTSELKLKTDELKRSYDSLAAANEQLKVHDRLQKEFINVAAHELRTPTQAILGYAELLQMSPEDRDEMIRAIYRNSVRLQRLTSDILDVTRIESEAFKIDKERFNLKDVILGAIQDAKNQLPDGRIEFVYEPTDIYVHADRGRITQVISNLLDNAAKFTKRGTITVSTENKNGQAVVSVQDTGSGIDSDIMPRLFSKFASKSDKGTGLGLFISRSIIEAHDGRIWCTNNSDGKGATFAFSLPLSSSSQT
ncbi:sensor histidine kinase [Candidatus Nitrososphaera gargensis]|uniref:sensor histidine kinase n=1 Tax=Candidatus Nitrososphaera gargensis TaxID=497727 RepID=UPI00164F8C1A|nr:sensor histidine kinase [Candidatus Nitrososphaera gargensis]